MEAKFPCRIEKPWGFELLLAHTPAYAGKLLFIKGGQRLSLQYHKKKDESIYLYQGEARIEVTGKDGRLVQTVAQAGYCLRILPLTKHRLEAIQDTIIFEVSTPELEDLERLEDDYGRTEPLVK